MVVDQDKVKADLQRLQDEFDVIQDSWEDLKRAIDGVRSSISHATFFIEKLQEELGWVTTALARKDEPK